MRKNLRRVLTLIMVIMILAPVETLAASTPYDDVTKEAVGATAYKAITYVKKHHGYKKVVTGKEFCPDQEITRAEFLAMLGNFYGRKKVPVGLADVLKANKGITAEWASKKLTKVASKRKVCLGFAYGSGRGMSLNGKTTKSKLTRAEASELLYSFAKSSKKLKPRK